MTEPLRMPDRQTAPPARDMRWIAGGTFRMGSENFYPEERPVHPVSVDGFWIDEHTVTVAEFRRFVKATGYVTLAEQPLDAAQYPDADPELLVSGGLVFRKASRPVDLSDYRNWWAYVAGASWRHPEGPRLGRHPGGDGRRRERAPPRSCRSRLHHEPARLARRRPWPTRTASPDAGGCRPVPRVAWAKRSYRWCDLAHVGPPSYGVLALKVLHKRRRLIRFRAS